MERNEKDVQSIIIILNESLGLGLGLLGLLGLILTLIALIALALIFRGGLLTEKYRKICYC